jgi:NADH-quinone oxidoreductase subunit J
LGVATIVVYAGAILVTFLFVLMLAQPEGQAFYDRLSWEAFLSAATGAALVGILSLSVATILSPPAGAPAAPLAQHSAADLKKNILSEKHVAHLGAELFSRQLIAVEVAGTLLLVALVAAVAIIAQAKSEDPRPARRPPGGAHG